VSVIREESGNLCARGREICRENPDIIRAVHLWDRWQASRAIGVWPHWEIGNPGDMMFNHFEFAIRETSMSGEQLSAQHCRMIEA
jgi:hypothetical protein